MRSHVIFASGLFFFTACGGATATGTGGAMSTTTSSASVQTTVTSGASTSGSTTAASSTGTGGAASGTATLRVHYPAQGHTMTVRGSVPGLSWNQGQSMTASGDTFTYTIANLSTSGEYKPLLDDATWARGPNYHVAPGE